MNNAIMTIFPTLLTVLSGLFYIKYQKEKEKRIEIEKQLSDKRSKVYNDINLLVFDLFKQTKKLKTLKHNDLENRMIDIIKELIMYGSESVLQKFIQWKKISAKENDDTAMSLKLMMEILIQIRKDMGYYNTKMTCDDILSMIVIDYENNKDKLGL